MTLMIKSTMLLPKPWKWSKSYASDEGCTPEIARDMQVLVLYDLVMLIGMFLFASLFYQSLN
jgi:hypothetical protein